MTFKTYKNSAEARKAFIQALNQRKVWEEKMRQKMEAIGFIGQPSAEPQL